MHGSTRVPEPLYAVVLVGHEAHSFEFSLEHARKAAKFMLERHELASAAEILTRNTGGTFSVLHERVTRP